MIEKKNISKIFWTEAMAGGLVIGVLVFVTTLLSHFQMVNYGGSSGLISLLQLMVLIGGIIYFSRRMRDFRGPVLGYPYGAAFGFIVATMLFTGLVYGIGLFFLQTVIAPEFYLEMLEERWFDILQDEDVVINFLDTWKKVNPILMLAFYVIIGILIMVVNGGLIGLIAAAFMKRPEDPFAGQQDDEYNPGVIE